MPIILTHTMLYNHLLLGLIVSNKLTVHLKSGSLIFITYGLFALYSPNDIRYPTVALFGTIQSPWYFFEGVWG